METTKILLKINYLDHNHHIDSDDDDGNQRKEGTINEISNENSMYIVS